MRTDEIIIRIIGKLDLMYGNVINQQDVKVMLEEVLCNYEISPKETALVPLNNMQDMMMLYLASKKIEGSSKNTIESYGRNLLKFSNDIIKNVEDVTAMDIRIHLANYAKTGVKNTTIATRTDILRGFFGWLQSEEYIVKNPMDRIKTIKAEPEPREPLTYEELEILRTGCKTLRQRALLEFAYATACRLSEIVQVNIFDIDWNEMCLDVVGKGNKERRVYFNAKAKVHLKRYLNSRKDSCDALFVTERKPIKRLENRGIQREIKKIQQQSGLKKNVFMHLLRHSQATNLLNSGADITTVQSILGHSELSTTQIYSKTSDSNVKYEYKKYMAN